MVYYAFSGVEYGADTHGIQIGESQAPAGAAGRKADGYLSSFFFSGKTMLMDQTAEKQGVRQKSITPTGLSAYLCWASTMA